MEQIRAELNAGPNVTAVDTKWLQNSNTIGLGYDLNSGSPVCYTGECQMEGFRHQAFKLSITKEPVGSCTDKLIPQHVGIQCMSSIQSTANTESISTLDELMKTTKSGIDVSGSVNAYQNAFSYGNSRETRSIIDTIMKSNSTVYLTRATISWVRLTAYVPRLELSDDFVHAVDNIPCCTLSLRAEKYINESFIDIFGAMFVKDILLGGIAQQKIVISEQNRTMLNSNGFSKSNEAELKAAANLVFSAGAKIKLSNQFDQTKLNAFIKYSQQTSITTLGGDPILQSIEDWSKTIPSNPTIIKFTVAPIVDLLTSDRFPNDSNINAKRQMIEAVQNKSRSTLECYHDCSRRGKCEPTAYFGFGQCRCDAGWSGTDCSVAQQVHNGFVSFSFNQQCSYGNRAERVFVGTHSMKKKLFSSKYKKGIAINIVFCFLKNTKAEQASLRTMCGWVSGDTTILCGNMNPRSEPCPLGYVKGSIELVPPDHSVPAGYGAGNPIWTCLKSDITAMDSPGTICGLHTDRSPETLVECDGYNPGQKKCPPDFMHHRTNFIKHKAMWIAAFDFCWKS